MPLMYSQEENGEVCFARTDGIQDAEFSVGEDEADELRIAYMDDTVTIWGDKQARDFRDALIALSVNKPAPAVEKPLDDDATDLIQ